MEEEVMGWNIRNKLFSLQAKHIKMKKTADNPFFKSKYIPLEAILETYLPIFDKENILCMHLIQGGVLVTELYDFDSGTSVNSNFQLNATDPQKQGSEITYGKRYNLWCLLNIQTDVDDDANIASNITKSTSNTVSGKWEKHTCQKCDEIVTVTPFKGKYWMCFKCTSCNGFSKPAPVYDWEDLSEMAF